MRTRIHQLIIKQLKGKISPEERVELDEFTARSPENKEVVENLTDPKQLLQMIKLSRELNVDAAWQKIASPGTPRVVLIRRCVATAIALLAPSRRYVVAAVVLIIISFAGWALLHNNRKKEPPTVKEESHSSPYHHALLTLGNGQVLKLNEVEDGSLGDDGMLTKKDGELIYPLNYQPKQPGMNILETLNGNFYRLRLPDGSIAWLNSASSIQYPNSFTGGNRTVTVQGEVYFEVAKNPAKPFIVKNASDVEIEVKGTKFYVDAYKGNNTVKTTLVEGSVEIKRDGHTELLKPGEQAIATVGKILQKVKVPNAERRVQGWKENKFTWVGADITTIFEDLSHWYGYNLRYKTNLPSRPYTFNLDRSLKLDDIFEVLQTGTGLTIKLDNNTIVISR